PAENFNGEATISYTISDGEESSSAEVAVTVDAVNDKAVIGGDVSIASDETDTALTLGGTLTSSDVDNADNTFTATSIEGTNGTFSIAENGEWTFVANSAFNDMNVGDSKVESFTVTSVDGTEQVVKVTINGTNDAATIAGDTTGTLLEDDETSLSVGIVSTGGKLTITDVDSGDNPSFDTSRVETSDDTLGSLTISADGTWSYKVDNDKLQSLAQVAELVERFTVYATDGTSEEIVVKVGGVDDVSVISDDSINSLTIDEDETLTLSLPLEITDIDNGENPSFPSGSINGAFGVLVISDTSTPGNSTWEYQLDTTKAQYLNDGESVQEKITVTASDGTDYEIIVTINGTNDAPTVDAVISKSVLEGGELLTGSVDASDVDSDSLSFSVTGSTPSGFTLNTDGTWSFDPKDAAYDSLAVGDITDVEVTVQVADGKGGTDTQTITITVTGTNDAPVATADLVSTSSSNAVTIDALANDTDVDGDTLSISDASVAVPSQGSVSIVDNKLVFTATEGFSGTATINYSISDGKGGTDTSTVTVNVNLVTIDAITPDDVINAIEADSTIAVTGTASGGDIAEGDTVTLVINGTTYTTKVAENGTWSVGVVGSDLSGDTAFDAVVTSSDAAGNTVESKATSTHTVDLNIATPGITFEDAGVDGIYNADEVGEDNTITATISVAGSEVGDKLSYSVNGVETTITLGADDISNGVEIEVSPGAEVKATLSDAAGNRSSEVSKTAADADISVAPPIITNITDDSDSSDYSTVTLHGTGEAGAVITLWAVSGSTTAGNNTQTGEYTKLASVTTTVSADGSWTLDVSNLSDTPVNDNELFKVTQSDAAGNTSDFSNTAHYWHGDWAAVQTEAGDDYVLAGSGNDSITINVDDQNNALSVDGGSGNDTVIFQNFDVSKAIFTLDNNGNLQINRGDTSDVVLLIDVENVKIGGTTYTIDALFTPTVSISDDLNDDGYLNGGESDGTVTVIVTLPIGAKAGDTLSITTNNGESNRVITLSDEDISLGSLSVSGIVETDEGTTLSVTAQLSTGSVASTDSVILDTVAEVGTVTVNLITDDNKIDGIELGQTISISGKAVGGDISVGDVVKMTINNTEYSTTVKAGGIWIIAGVLGSDLAADSEFDVVVTSSDAAGNKVESIGTSTHSVDLSAEASFSLAEGQQHILTDLPEGFAFPDGTTEVVTNFGGTITLGDDGEYRYDAPVRDHGDAVSDKDSVTVTLEDGRTFTVNLDIQDSAPVAVDDQDSIVVQHEEFEVSEIAASWVSYTHGESVTTFDGTSDLGGVDNDSAKDQIRWGNPAESKQSGYGFIDNDSNLEGRFDLNQDISVGTFTHYNYPINSGGAITSAEMSVEFFVLDHLGVSTPVTLTVNFDHNETPNTNDVNASRDIVTVQNTHVTFERDGDIYTLQIVGFREVGNPDGEVVTSIYTNENAATSYELVVRVVEGDGYSLPSTEGNIFDDNGLGADSLGADSSVIVVGVAVGATVSSNDSVGHSIEGQYGNLVLNSDGSYVYEVTASVSDIPAGATESFAYLIQDQDGSTSSANLSINVGTNTAPKAQDDSTPDSLFAGLVGEYYGTNSQLNNISDFRTLVVNKEADATFEAANISYGRGSSDVAKGTHLQEFLGSDASTLSTDPGDNTDGGIYLQGYVYLEAGTYNFKVTADDGYEITINGYPVATVESNQSVHTVTHASFTISESGYQAIDMIWWDQGGDYMFQPVLSSDGGDTYFVLDASILSSTGETPLATLADQALAISVDSLLENDTDADGDALTVTSISNVQNGYAYLNSEGVIHFTPLQGFTGVATFDYTISDGKGGKDTATASITVTADGVLPTVTVSTAESAPDYDVNAWEGHDSNFESEVLANHGNSQGGNDTYYLNGDLNNSASSGDGSDEIVITGNVNRTLTLDSGDFSGDGDDNLLVKGELNSNGSIYSGAGNDSVEIRGNANADIDLSDGGDRLAIGGSVNSNSEIDLGDGNDSVYVAHDLSGKIDAGDGNDTVEIGRNINSSGDVKLGKGDDVLLVQGDISGEIKGEDGNDAVIIHGNVWSDAKIDLGKGDDVITIDGKLYSDVDGGKGDDSIYLASYTKNDYNNNVDNIKSRVINFENVMMSDGIVKGDSSGFNNGSAMFSYSVSVEIDNANSTTDTSTLTLFGIPSTATLTLDGATLTANSDGNYDIEITSDQTSIENLNVLSNNPLPDLEITTTVSYSANGSSTVDEAADDDNYLVGTQGEDTLVGGLGDDILFGGDDEITDTLTGGDGKDIFILNDTTDVLNIDTITDFNATEDALDLTDLLTGIEGSPGKDADTDLITEFLSQHVKVTDGNVKVDGEDVATFIEETSSFDSNNDGLVNSSDSIKVIYNNEEYSINIDG
ncbi:VCBS domain-containing protein, partial [Marinomonas primoryensis]|uniref:VCBS domain-containing protein n=1 Tax=Marinomonas primoryensis TaxID=178399 RepID=UPI0031D17991